jgi:hypothetical protein
MREPSPLSKLIRPKCSECGNPVRWFTVTDAAGALGEPRMVEMLDSMPRGVPLRRVDFWVCTRLRPRCSGYGFLLPPVFSGVVYGG